ncbi:MAG: transposase domain-containing protein [[Clostridium] spiroforme]|uniref:Transposase domain-containing protein n=1 Tax=Thomasclavelia spiroformis TaxID=29348 RepID=A0A943EKB8_9FIRM|nr:transposase domain-containing protein [Thomasclavelia spiroformis]
MSYALEYEKGLRVYLDDGYVPMTNSLDERTIRPFTIGRKNWMFLASTKGANASAAAFSLIETAKANHLDPYDYIEYLLEIMPNIDFIKNPERLDDFMPWSDQTQSIF